VAENIKRIIMNILKRKKGILGLTARLRTSFLALLILCVSVLVTAQEGHPLTGTWSGDRESNGSKVRLLLIMDLQPDQRIEGTLIESGARIPLDITLNPEDWSVSIIAQGQNRAGDAVNYQANGVIENVGTSTQRMIVGTWQDGGNVGEFQVRMN
jgi:hypothetical protein